MKKHLRTIIPTLLLIFGIAMAMLGFIRDNQTRIARQNEMYLDELTTQRAISIDSLVSENLNFIQSSAYLYGENLTSPWADVAVIRAYEQASVFDHLRFIDATGDDYTSVGVMANLADRAYFQAGMRGESGVVFVDASRVTQEKQVGFYAPVRYQGEIIGVMVGFYGEAYLQRLLEYQLFGYDGEGYLCDRQGTVLGATMEDAPDNYLEYLGADGRCAASELQRLTADFAAGEDTAYQYIADGDSATGYAVALQNTDWILVRTFPPSASRGILSAANREGTYLIVEMLIMFGIYGLYLGLRMLFDMKKTREAARDARDVSTGTSKLFEKFVAVDLRQKTYRYVAGTPDDAALAMEGDYDALCQTVLKRVPDDAHRREVAALMSPEGLTQALTGADRVAQRVHAPVREDEWFTYNFIVIERDGGAPARLLLVSQDVTSLYRREEAEQKRLQDALDAAERASRAKTEFLFNMSHDLRTPMNAIIGYTELADRDGVSGEDMRGYVRKIAASSGHLLALINDILEMSRIESGKLTLEMAETDLIAVMDDAREMFSAQMARKGIAFTVTTEGVRDGWALCDRNRLDRVVLNLISNAYKFTGEGGSVAASLTQTGAEGEDALYELRVKDTGIGMSPEFVEKLFTPFERERTSTVSRTQGTGLGLSITKKIVDMMGGSIDVLTKQGEGTEFVIRLRLQRVAPPEKCEKAESAIPAVDFGKARLLLVEDNEINREIATMILGQMGFAIETAENGQIAVDKVAASSPGYFDAVLMDIQMPVMDGYTAARAIRALKDPALAGLPIVAMTANAFHEDVQAALDAGMNGHIAKPLDVNKMVETLSQILSK